MGSFPFQVAGTIWTMKSQGHFHVWIGAVGGLVLSPPGHGYTGHFRQRAASLSHVIYLLRTLLPSHRSDYQIVVSRFWQGDVLPCFLLFPLCPFFFFSFFSSSFSSCFLFLFFFFSSSCQLWKDFKPRFHMVTTGD